MIILRKGKKILGKYSEPYSVADDVNTLAGIFPAEHVKAVQQFIRRNAFSFAIRGAKARLGGGVILENVPASA